MRIGRPAKLLDDWTHFGYYSKSSRISFLVSGVVYVSWKGTRGMKNEPVDGAESISSLPKRRLGRKPVVIVAVVVLVALLCGVYLWVASNAVRKGDSTEKVLTVADLESNNSDTKLTSETSSASVDNLTKELKLRIDKQIADKENPIETVRTLVAVLCNTTNSSRPTQCVDYVTEFLNTKMDVLKLESYNYGLPSELQTTLWRAEFYTSLVNGYGLIAHNKLTYLDGKPIDAIAAQIKYVDLYLAIAQDPANWGEPQISEYDGHTWYYYDYTSTQEFVELRKRLTAGDAQ